MAPPPALTPTGRPQRRLGPRDPRITSTMMSRVRSKNTKPELALRQALHRAGMRYRLHAPDVLGHPDIVHRGHKLAVFVDGDLWHGNPAEARRRGRESLADLFPTRTEWWMAKIQRTVQRDQDVTETLTAEGWTVLRIWESDVRADPDAAAQRVLRETH